MPTLLETHTRTLQQRLAALGCEPGAADGQFGMATLRAVNRALDMLEGYTVVPNGPATAPASGEQVTSAEGRKVIAEREGNKLQAYQDSVGVWTIGVGHTSAAGAPAVIKGMTISAELSDEILSLDLKTFEHSVRFIVEVPLAQHEFDALVSLAFNIGAGAFGKSTLVKKLNAGDRAAAAEQFLVWTKAGGQTLKGLVSRRQAEREQFLGRMKG